MEGSAMSPRIDTVLADPATSDWLRVALQAAIKRDPVDAANDAELLFATLKAHLDARLGIASENVK